MKCKKYTLKELATIKYGKNQAKVLSATGSVPIYGTGGIMGYASTFLYDKASVLIGRKGSIGKVKYVEHPFWTVDTLFYTEINQELVLPRFLYYLLSQYDFNQYNEGTTIPSLRTETLNRLEYSIPPIPTQRKITAILTSLDDKIENNSAICKNLEEQAAALYKSWFVDFEPFGGVRPEKWAHRCLGEICVVGAGGDKPAEYSLQRTKEYSVPIFSNGLDNDGLFAYAKTARINEESVTVSARGTIGCVCLRHEPYFPIVRLLTIIPKKNLSSKYVYLTLKRMRIEGCGTTQQQLTVPDFSKTVILVPSNEVALAFTQIVTPLFEMMWNLQAENNALSSLRDTLLPKIMSGEIQPETISK